MAVSRVDVPKSNSTVGAPGAVTYCVANAARRATANSSSGDMAGFVSTSTLTMDPVKSNGAVYASLMPDRLRPMSIPTGDTMAGTKAMIPEDTTEPSTRSDARAGPPDTLSCDTVTSNDPTGRGEGDRTTV